MQQRYSEGYLPAGRQVYLTREGPFVLSTLKEKSAEVIVVASNEPLKRTEVSQSSEGLNVKSFLIR